MQGVPAPPDRRLIDKLARQASQTRPELSRWESAFQAELATQASKREDRIQWLEQLHAPDLLLAFACLRGDAKALAVLETEFLTGICTALAKKARRPHLATDIHQALRERLLVPSARSGPRLASYSGGGPLGIWLHVVATRICIDLRRAEGDAGRNQDAASVPQPGPGDPELAFLKTRYAAELSKAFEATLVELLPRDRTLLRLHYIDGMSTTALGKMHGVHGTTVMRWMSQARESILEKVRVALRGQLKLSDTELDSILALALSRVHIDLSQQLKSR